MNLVDLLDRKIPPVPWEEGEKIPWNDPGFSARMLHEHLSQEHDAASRRKEIIDQHVSWIHSAVLGGIPSRILDLGCGPGFYLERLAKSGHTCVGIDFAPASIRYAREQAAENDLDCIYLEADVRQADFGSGYDLVMMVHGELNVFRPQETGVILEKARQALVPGGQLLIEMHTLDAVRMMGERGSSWYTKVSGLFSQRPHLLLEEAYWDVQLRVATERYFVIDAESGDVVRYAASTQGYTEGEYARLLENCGFGEIRVYPSLGGMSGRVDKNYVVYRSKTA